MKEEIERNLEWLSRLTKDEAEFVEHIIKWDDEQRLAFMLAKRIFDENINDNKPQAK